MPILHKWNRIHRQSKSLRQQQQQNTSDLNNKDTKLDIMTDIQLNGHTLTKMNGVATKEAGDTYNLNIPSEHHKLLTTNSVNSTTVFKHGNGHLHQRISNLESKIEHLYVDFDRNFNSIIAMLEDMKDKTGKNSCRCSCRNSAK
jgi:hypothetical protein